MTTHRMPFSDNSLRLGLACLACLACLVGCGAPAPRPEKSPPAAPASQPAVSPAAPAAAATGAPSLAPADPDPVPPGCVAYQKKIVDSYLPYLDAFSNYGHELSPDRRGKWLLFRSNRGGRAFQLYLARARPTAKPRLIAEAKDRVGSAKFTPDGKHVLFLRDRDNNENWQIFRAAVSDGKAEPLTATPARFHSLPWVTRDGKTLVYIRGEHKKSAYEVVTRPSAVAGKERLVVSLKGFHFLSDLSPDGKQALLTKLISPSRSVQQVLDLEGGTLRRLAPSKEAKGHAHSGVFSADGKSVYLITDEGSPRAQLRRLDAATGAEQARFADPAAEIAAVEVSRKGQLVAVKLDAGSHSSVKLLDARTLKVKLTPRIAPGRSDLGSFSADGRRLVLTYSNPAQPTDVFAVDTRSGKLKPLRRDVRPGLAKLHPVVSFVQRVDSFDGTKVPVNVYLPKRKQKQGLRRPVLVSVHGGPAHSSQISWSPFVAFFIARGFVVVEPNVRGSTGFGKAYERADNGRKRLDAVKDLRAVNKWIRAQPWARPDQLVVFGGSYGGYMTYMALGHQPKQWAAGIGLVGVVNLRTFLATTSGAIRLAFREEFGELEKDGPFLDSVSPIRVVDRMTAPLFVYQGATDPRVPRSEQDQLVRALRKDKRKVEYMVAADEGHSLSHRHNKLSMIGRVNRFLDVHLGREGVPAACK